AVVVRAIHQVLVVDAVGAVGAQVVLAGPVVGSDLESSCVAVPLLINLGADVGDGLAGPALGPHPLDRVAARLGRRDRHVGLVARGGPELASVALLARVALARDRSAEPIDRHGATPFLGERIRLSHGMLACSCSSYAHASPAG